MKKRAGTTAAPRFESRILGFVDILGFRSIVARMRDDPRLYETIRDMLDLLLRQEKVLSKYRKQRTRGGKASVPPRGSPSNITMTAFSDCYVICS